MNLNLQIHTLLFSFFFGILFSLCLNFASKLIYHHKKIYQILFTLIFVVGSILIYFMGIQKINNGIFHPYEAVMIIIGFILENSLHKSLLAMIAKYKKK